MKIYPGGREAMLEVTTGHKGSKVVGDTDLRAIQEAELKGFGDQLYKVDWEREEIILKSPSQGMRECMLTQG